MAEATGHLAEHPPVRARLSRRRQERALARDAALGIGHRAILLPPGRRGQANPRMAQGIGVIDTVGHHQGLAAGQCLSHPGAVGQRYRGVGGNHPKKLHVAPSDGLEQLDSAQPGARGYLRGAPEARHLLPVLRIVQLHVCRQLIGQATHFAPPHGVGLPGNRKGAGAGSTDAAGSQVAVENRAALVDASRRLVDALGEQRDRARCLRKPAVESLQLFRWQATGSSARSEIRVARKTRRCLRLEALGVPPDKVAVDRLLPHQPGQQTVEEVTVAARRQRQVQVRQLAGGCLPRVDYHHPQPRPQRLFGGDTLVQDRVGPGQIGAGDHQQIRQFQIAIIAGHRVAAEYPLVGGNRRRHAQAAVGIDIGAAQEALHQLVGNVVIFGQKLTRNIERHGLGAVARQSAAQGARDLVQGLIPGGTATLDFRVEQAPLVTQRFPQGAALDAQPTEIGGMVGVAADRDLAGLSLADGHPDPAADTAVGAGGTDRAAHAASRPSNKRSLSSTACAD